MLGVTLRLNVYSAAAYSYIHTCGAIESKTSCTCVSRQSICEWHYQRLFDGLNEQHMAAAWPLLQSKFDFTAVVNTQIGQNKVNRFLCDVGAEDALGWSI